MLNANAILWRFFLFSVSGKMRKEPLPLVTVFCSHRFQPNYSRGLCDEKEVKKEYVPTGHLLPVGDCLLEDLSDAPTQAGAESLNIRADNAGSSARVIAGYWEGKVELDDTERNIQKAHCEPY